MKKNLSIIYLLFFLSMCINDQDNTFNSPILEQFGININDSAKKLIDYVKNNIKNYIIEKNQVIYPGAFLENKNISYTIINFYNDKISDITIIFDPITLSRVSLYQNYFDILKLYYPVKIKAQLTVFTIDGRTFIEMNPFKGKIFYLHYYVKNHKKIISETLNKINLLGGSNCIQISVSGGIRYNPGFIQ